MGRPPCCDKVGIKKGPWTPEEDIILVSYIQEHGPGNWRAVPTNTGLLRCSKSCRLRWTNYLRPGIKRGNFTPHEEGMIIHLQALLGNKWAAIATYLPQRTDNDIKNYWNTHLKKKLKRFHEPHNQKASSSNPAPNNFRQFMSNGHDERVVMIDSGIDKYENPSVYASSAENISRLLQGWMRSSSSSPSQANNKNNYYINNNSEENRDMFYRDFEKNIVPTDDINPCGDQYVSNSIQCYGTHQVQGINGMSSNDDHQELERIWPFDHHHNVANCERSSCESSHKGSESSTGLLDHQEKARFLNVDHKKMKMDDDPPLSFLEKWLLDESAGHVEGLMELPSIF